MIGKFSASAQVRKATSLAATQVVTLHFVLSPCSDPGEGETAANNAEHVRMVRKCIKKTNPDAACLGEHVRCGLVLTREDNCCWTLTTL